MNIYLEIFGYIGTALVLLSMMMTSVKKLRYFNIAGSVISATYAALCGTWPVVVLNAGLTVINVVQLVRSYVSGGKFTAVTARCSDESVRHLTKLFGADADFMNTPDAVVHIIYVRERAIALAFEGRGGDKECRIICAKDENEATVRRFIKENQVGVYTKEI